MVDESGAGYLASIFGTEKDKVNCSFFFKTGSCRHGDACSRAHNKPPMSQTILIRNLYIPILQPGENPTDHFEDFYDDIFSEMNKHGRVVDMVVCENAGVHLAGNTYIKFEDEEQAAAAMAAVQGRFFAGRPLQAEFTPVTDFWEGICKQLEKEGQCGRGAQCNFMHLKKIGPDLERDLYPNGRVQSRGYSGGAFGRTDRMGFDRASSYDRGQYDNNNNNNNNFGGGGRRNYDRRNDRRNYGRNDNNGGGDFQRRDYDRRDHERRDFDRRDNQRRDYDRSTDFHNGGGPPHHDGGRHHHQQHQRFDDRRPSQHIRFDQDDNNANYPPPPPPPHDSAPHFDDNRGRDHHRDRRDYERRPRSRSPRPQ